jgi:hypothetical protein
MMHKENFMNIFKNSFIPTVDEDELTKYIHSKLIDKGIIVNPEIINIILDYELEYLSELNIVKQK